ncbi:hypothetical protein ACFY0R_37905 [Streptomyces sp. NPDC001633]|uniref:hypothetical protein n=1 Tax=Streptomyces sp. NPDC001633 TaxID=3364595 RepID=UPI0036A15F00
MHSIEAQISTLSNALWGNTATDVVFPLRRGRVPEIHGVRRTSFGYLPAQAVRYAAVDYRRTQLADLLAELLCQDPRAAVRETGSWHRLTVRRRRRPTLATNRTASALIRRTAQQSGVQYGMAVVVAHLRMADYRKGGRRQYLTEETMARRGLALVRLHQEMVNPDEPALDANLSGAMTDVLHAAAEHHNPHYVLAEAMQVEWSVPARGTSPTAARAFIGAMTDLYVAATLTPEMCPDMLTQSAMTLMHIERREALRTPRITHDATAGSLRI